MKAQITNDPRVAAGTSLKGYVKTDISTLTTKLGLPRTGHSGDGKVKCEWIIEFDNKEVATIYDWKTKEIPTAEYEWHIGGKTSSVVEKVGQFLQLNAVIC